MPHSFIPNPRLIKHLIVVGGATASGKTAFAVHIAQYFKTVVVSADSRQIYSELQIGTARPLAHELMNVPHYFLGTKTIHELYSVGDYEREVSALLETLFEQHDIVVLCGGTGLYINAVCNGLDAIPDVPESVKTQLYADFEQHGLAFLQAELAERDPVYYTEVDTQNHHRLLRALGVCRATEQPFSTFRTANTKKRVFKPVFIALDWQRATLYDRIDKRVEMMIQDGLLAEAAPLLPYRDLNALHTVGYTEIFDFLAHKHDLKTAIKLIQQHSRNYAKRQLTWFRRNDVYHFFKAESLDMNEVFAFLNEKLHTS
jgi:tRNA dimethylallyltransferase